MNRISEYQNFIFALNKNINKFFENQKEYIHCHEGCTLCCEDGEYPCSQIEAEFLKEGIKSLSHDKQKTINENINRVKEETINSKEEPFTYQCPFLINNRCSIYEYRMIICRTFGLPYFVENKNGERRIKTPFCVEHGLNYSEIYDKEKHQLSSELFRQKSFKNEPAAFNISLEYLINNLGKENINLDFGEIKNLIDWF